MPEQNFAPMEVQGVHNSPPEALSPEVEKNILGKLVDINARGTAVTAINPSTLRSIFSHGLLGMDREYITHHMGDKLLGSSSNIFFDSDKQQQAVSNWAAYIRGDRENLEHGMNFFNIIKSGGEYKDRSVKTLYYFSVELSDETIGLVLDTSSLKRAGVLETIRAEKENNFRPGLYYPHITMGYTTSQVYESAILRAFKTLDVTEDQARESLLKSKDIDPVTGEYKVTTDTGFRTFGRFAPRRIKGVIYRPLPILSEEDRTSRVNELVKDMRAGVKDNKDLDPIYGVDGNLLWPKQMTYEQVCDFVTHKEEGAA